MRGRGHHGRSYGRHGGFHHNRHGGFNHSRHRSFPHGHPVTQQPLHLRYDFDWESKPSTNGEFKYGLFQCCSGPTETDTVMCLFFMSVLLWPGWILLAQANYELGEVIGTN